MESKNVCRFKGCSNPAWRGADACLECMEEMASPEDEPEYELLDSEDMPVYDLGEERR